MNRAYKLISVFIVTLLVAGCGVKKETLMRTHPWNDQSRTWTKICEPTPDQVSCFLDKHLPCEIDDKVDHCTKEAKTNLKDDVSKLNQAKVMEQADQITVVFSDDVFFETASAELSSRAKKTLDRLADVLGDYPDASVSVQGHTDPRPINTTRFPDNQALSEARAEAVVNYLSSEKGLASSRFSAKGFGSSEPVTTEEAELERNRRVEFVISPPE